MTDTLDQRCRDLVEALGLGRGDAVTRVQPLTGGVASDIARVDLGHRSYCVKFALPKLRVAVDWFAPVHRSRAEYDWLMLAGQVAPGAAPQLFGHDAERHGFAMEFLAGPDVVLWKSQLLAGVAPAGRAAAVADVIGRVHAAGAAPGFVQAAFANQSDFHAIRTEPYLLYTAQQHPDLAARLIALADSLSAPITVVHGDVSPKNILFRAGRPVLLDAECASMGDPAFDVAFCLNHLLLKALHLPATRALMRAEVRAFWQGYRRHVDWEDVDALQARVAALLPGLMLARVDGRSPVEYLTAAAQAQVRALARPLIAQPVVRLDAVLDAVLSHGE